MPFTFHDWIYSNYAVNEPLNGRWGIIHFAVIAACLALIVLLGIWGRRCPRARRPIIVVLICFILLFELARRGINLSKDYSSALTLHDYLYLLLPRPWCAMACWMLIFSLFIRTKSMQNLCSMNALLCALVFFAYPEVGFIHKYYFFENVYSIATHSLLLITSILLIVYEHTDFRYARKRWSCAIWELFGMGALVAYAIVISPLVLGVEPDPMSFLPGEANAVMRVLGFSYPVYLAVYVGFLLLYFNLFYFIQYIVTPGKTGVKYHVPLGKHVVRLLFTFGLWPLMWVFKTTRYTNQVEGALRRHPCGQLLLCMFIPFYYFFWVYKTAQRVDRLAEDQGIRCALTVPCLFTSVFLPILTPVLLQDMINDTVIAADAFEKAKAELFPEQTEYSSADEAAADTTIPAWTLSDPIPTVEEDEPMATSPVVTLNHEYSAVTSPDITEDAPDITEDAPLPTENSEQPAQPLYEEPTERVPQEPLADIPEQQ